MDDQNRNLILAMALSMGVLLIWFALFPPPVEDPNAIAQAPAGTEQADTLAPSAVPGATGSATLTTGTVNAAEVAEAPRVAIETDRLSGSISLRGGRIDELFLKDYHITPDPESGDVQVLSPLGTTTQTPYYALFGWAPGAGLTPEAVPGPDTIWQLESGDSIGVNAPVTLRWDSPAGLTFRRSIVLDEDFMFSVTQSVSNESGGRVSMAPYGIVTRHGLPQDLKKFFILHEGAIAMSDGELTETKWDDIQDLDVDPNEGARAEVHRVTENGWIGFTDHYWMTTLIPEPGSAFKAVTKYVDGRDIFQAEAVLPTRALENGETVTVTTQLFAGAKEWETIRSYQRAGVDRFIDSIDWGWFFFLTKPIFAVLHWLNSVIGNMGVSIIALTLLIKALLFPLAYKSYVSMAKMKDLQPQMEKIKETAGDDRERLQKEMMELYKREKVNPAAGCLPILPQIPIFFSLYKVIFVTLELRHANFFGPFADLSAPDPTSIFNLFGLLPYAAPEPGSLLATAFIGVLPILLGVSMWLQQKLNPAPTDPTQAMIFAWMPWVFMFMLGGFASGLVVYWIANNTITFTQQYLIMRTQGIKPDIFGNIKSGMGAMRGKKGKPDEK